MSAKWLKIECTLIRPTPGAVWKLRADRIGFFHDSDSKRLHKTIQLNQLDACQTDAGSGRLTIAMLCVHYLYCCIFECRDIVFTCPSSPSSPPWLLVHWLGCFSPFCVVTKSLDRSLVGQVQIVCSLHDRHKGQFRSTLPPSPFAGMAAGQQYGGTDGGREKEGLEGWSQTLWAALSCWESALPIVQQHPLFFIHRPLCPPPAVLLYNRLWMEALMLTYSCKHFIWTFWVICYIRPK